MVGVIVRLQLTLARNRVAVGRGAQVALGVVVGFVLALGTVALAFLDLSAAVRRDLVAIALGLWLIGWLVAPSFTGGPELTGSYFRLHPISRATLTRGLFAAAWTGLPALVSLVALGVLPAFAAPLGPAAFVVALLAAPLSVSVLLLASRLVAVWFAAVSRSRLGAAMSSTVTAAIIVLAQHSWLLIVAVVISVDTGLPGTLGTVLRALPTSWGLVAVTAAGDGEWWYALLALGALLVLCLLLYLAWTTVVTAAPLRPSLVRAPRRTRIHIGPLRKELLTWVRDPLRLQNVVLALAYAIGTCALPLILDFGALLPFLGVTVLVMGVVTSSNLYGTSSTALWLTLMVPGSERADVRSRQLGWLVVFGGLAVVLTAVGIALHPDPGLLPWVAVSLLAVVGAGAGLVVLMSVMVLVPGRDPHVARHSPADQGDATGPAFLALFAVLGLAAPPLGLLAGWQVTGATTWLWAGVVLGVASAAGLPAWFGSVAARRLRDRGPELLHLMRSGPARPSDDATTTDATTTTDGELAVSAKPSGFEAMRGAEAPAFWALYVLAVVTVVPQGLVAGAHLLAGSEVRSWFLALYVPEPLRWPTVAGLVVLGLVAIGCAMGIHRRARRRAQRALAPVS